MYKVDNQSIAAAQQFNDERFTKIDIIKRRRSIAFVLNFIPGQHMKSYRHPSRELYLCVLEGNGTLSIDDKVLKTKKGDVFYCEPEEQIGFTNTGAEPVSIFATMTKIE